MIHHLLDKLRKEILTGVSVAEICAHYNVPVPEGSEGVTAASCCSASWESFRLNLKNDEMGVNMQGTTIESYLKALAQDLEKLTALAKKHQENEPLLELFEQEIETFRATYQKIKVFLGGPETTRASVPLIKFFSAKKTLSERLIAHDTCEKLFIHDTENLVSCCSALDRLKTGSLCMYHVS